MTIGGAFALGFALGALQAGPAHPAPVAGDAASGAAAVEPPEPTPQSVPSPWQTDPLNPTAEVLITAKRDSSGLEVEREYGEEELAAQGAETISELLDRLGLAQTGAGEPPLLLVDGKLIGLDRSLLRFPPEALQGLSVLRPDAAAKFGAAPGRTVINLKPKPVFHSRDASGRVQTPTRGGMMRANISLGQQSIVGPNRWHAQLQVDGDTGMRSSARKLTPHNGPIDLIGYISGPLGGEIDPGLSALTGQLVTIAALPGIWTRPLQLADFAMTAGMSHPGDPAQYETVRGARVNQAVNIGWSRQFGRWGANISLSGSRTRGHSLRGLAMASVVLPASHDANPFSNDVQLVRPLNAGQALRQENAGENLTATATVNGELWRIQTTLSGQYGWSSGHSRHMRGVDVARIQGMLDGNDPALNPFAPWGNDLLRIDALRSTGQQYSLNATMMRPLITLPAGQVSLAINGQYNGSENATAHQSGSYRAFSDRYGWDASLSLPLAKGAGWIGDLSLSLRTGWQGARDQTGATSYSAAMVWAPLPNITLTGNWGRASLAADFGQLHGVEYETTRSIYDLARQEMVEVIWLTGGNPALRNGRMDSWSVQLGVSPFGPRLLRFDTQLSSSDARDSISPLPEFSPAIESAFPARLTRDGAGRLVRIDARAINLGVARERQLTSSGQLRLERKRDSAYASIRIGHVMALQRDWAIAPGQPVVDQLIDNGQSRHMVQLTFSAGKRALGFSLNSNWSSPSSVAIPGAVAGQDRVHFTQPWVTGLNFHIQPSALWPGLDKRMPLFKQLRMTVDVENLFDSYRRARFANGDVPSGYTRDEVDPIGRSIRLSLRKRL